MNRRSFLQTLTAVIVAPLVMTATPKPKAIEVTFSAAAFKAISELSAYEYKVRHLDPAGKALADDIDARFLASLWRVDVLFGWAVCKPSAVCKVLA